MDVRIWVERAWGWEMNDGSLQLPCFFPHFHLGKDHRAKKVGRGTLALHSPWADGVVPPPPTPITSIIIAAPVLLSLHFHLY